MTTKSISPVNPTSAMRVSCWPSSHTVTDLLTGLPSAVAFRGPSTTAPSPGVGCAGPGHQLGQTGTIHASSDPNGMAAAVAHVQNHYMQNYYMQAMMHHHQTHQAVTSGSAAMSPIMSPHSLT